MSINTPYKGQFSIMFNYFNICPYPYYCIFHLYHLNAFILVFLLFMCISNCYWLILISGTAAQQPWTVNFDLWTLCLSGFCFICTAIPNVVQSVKSFYSSFVQVFSWFSWFSVLKAVISLLLYGYLPPFYLLRSSYYKRLVFLFHAE